MKEKIILKISGSDNHRPNQDRKEEHKESGDYRDMKLQFVRQESLPLFLRILQKVLPLKNKNVNDLCFDIHISHRDTSLILEIGHNIHVEFRSRNQSGRNTYVRSTSNDCESPDSFPFFDYRKAAGRL